MINSSHFSKFKEIKGDGTLFGVPQPTDRCGYCGNKLYIMMKRPLRYCKSKNCPHYTQFKKKFVTR
jgi:hypothetical protein